MTDIHLQTIEHYRMENFHIFSSGNGWHPLTPLAGKIPKNPQSSFWGSIQTSKRSAILFWVSFLGDEEKFLQQKNYKKGYFCIQSWLPRFFFQGCRVRNHQSWPSLNPFTTNTQALISVSLRPISSVETNKLDFSKSFSFSNSSLLSQDMTRWGWTRREGSNVMPFCRRQSSHTCFFFFSVERSLKSKPPGPYVPTKIFQTKLRAKSVC